VERSHQVFVFIFVASRQHFYSSSRALLVSGYMTGGSSFPSTFSRLKTRNHQSQRDGNWVWTVFVLQKIFSKEDLTCNRWEKDANQNCKSRCQISVDLIIRGSSHLFDVVGVLGLSNVLAIVQKVRVQVVPEHTALQPLDAALDRRVVGVEVWVADASFTEDVVQWSVHLFGTVLHGYVLQQPLAQNAYAEMREKRLASVESSTHFNYNSLSFPSTLVKIPT